jgi:hypothetical protein
MSLQRGDDAMSENKIVCPVCHGEKQGLCFVDSFNEAGQQTRGGLTLNAMLSVWRGRYG